MTCEKCGDAGSYAVDYPAETRVTADGTKWESRGSGTVHCACRQNLPAREGKAAWWTTESVYAVDLSIPIFNESVHINVSAEVPISEDNYRVHRRGNRYYPTTIDIETPTSLMLHSNTARDLARALIAAADAADAVDDQDVDSCGHWAPCECAKTDPAAAHERPTE